MSWHYIMNQEFPFFKKSLRTFNFKLFDNVKFGMPHLARDGLHLNLAGQSLLSECWVHCILLALGLKRGYLPLRRQYRNLCCEFSFRVKWVILLDNYFDSMNRTKLTRQTCLTEQTEKLTFKMFITKSWRNLNLS